MKKIFVCFLLVVTLALPVFAQFDDIQPDAVNLDAIDPADSVATVNNISGEHIKSFDSNIYVNEDGTIDVKETIVYDFGDLQRHGIYRFVQTTKTSQDKKTYKLDFSNFIVTKNGGNSEPYKITQTDKQIELKIGIKEIFVTGINTYTISYKVAGALTYFSDHDELYWNVTGNEWTVPIIRTTSQVVWPRNIKKEDIKTACYTGVYGSKESLCSVLPSLYDRAKMVIKSDNSLGSGEGLTIVMSFPKNIVAVLEPKKFVSFGDSFIGKLVGLVIGLLALTWYVGLPLFIVYRWLRYGRDPSTNSQAVSAWFDPPKTQDGKRFLTPGEVGTLGDETVDMKDISATIVDLARRGYLIIDEKKKGDFWLIRQEKQKKDDKLLTYEKLLLDKFFSGKVEIRIKDEELSGEVTQIKNEMYEQVVADKLFDKNPQTIRTGYYILAGIALFTGNLFLAIIAFLFGRVMPRKTGFGVEAKNVAFSLKNFLTSQKRQLEFQADKQMMFERLLPFAVAFGVEKIWAKRFESLNITQPNWHHSYSSAHFSSYMLVNGLNSSFRSVNTAATPTRSSSGFSSGFSGGSSGGGGGGGGGGSW